MKTSKNALRPRLATTVNSTQHKLRIWNLEFGIWNLNKLLLTLILTVMLFLDLPAQNSFTPASFSATSIAAPIANSTSLNSDILYDSSSINSLLAFVYDDGFTSSATNHITIKNGVTTTQLNLITGIVYPPGVTPTAVYSPDIVLMEDLAGTPSTSCKAMVVFSDYDIITNTTNTYLVELTITDPYGSSLSIAYNSGDIAQIVSTSFNNSFTNNNISIDGDYANDVFGIAYVEDNGTTTRISKQIYDGALGYYSISSTSVASTIPSTDYAACPDIAIGTNLTALPVEYYSYITYWHNPPLSTGNTRLRCDFDDGTSPSSPINVVNQPLNYCFPTCVVPYEELLTNPRITCQRSISTAGFIPHYAIIYGNRNTTSTLREIYYIHYSLPSTPLNISNNNITYPSCNSRFAIDWMDDAADDAFCAWRYSVTCPSTISPPPPPPPPSTVYGMLHPNTTPTSMDWEQVNLSSMPSGVPPYPPPTDVLDLTPTAVATDYTETDYIVAWFDIAAGNIDYKIRPINTTGFKQAPHTSTLKTETNLFYPNPAHDKINILNATQIQELTLTNMLGATVLHTNEVKNTLDIAHLPKGNYALKIKYRNSTFSTSKLSIR